MSFNSFDVVFLTAGFLVPGFVWSAVLSMLVPRRSVGGGVRLGEFLTLSCVNHGLWSWALVWLFKTDFLHQHPYWSGIFLASIIFLSPIGLGLLSARLSHKGAIAALLGRWGYQTIHPIAMAWDWHFNRKEPYWVTVTLKSGLRIYGLYGRRSFAGSDPERRDLYLEATFRPLETGDWASVEETAGILIMADQIAFIEFREVIEEVTYE